MDVLTPGPYPFSLPADAQVVEGGYLAHSSDLRLALPFRPQRYYRHGWQSWSLTAWVEPERSIPPLKPHRLQPLQTDPQYANDPRPNGAWLGAVEAPDGSVLLLGALTLETHVALEGNTLRGWSEAGTGEWFVAFGAEREAFTAYTKLLAERFGTPSPQKAARVWCSWYSFYTQITEQRLLEVFGDLAELPFDVIQVDDGWQTGIGDWEPNPKFPSGMAALARRIRAMGRTAGLWLAPLLVAPSTSLYRQHPDWLLRDERGHLVSAGFNWNDPLYALDTTHPQALEWLAALMKKVRAWGYDYLKLDFLYAGALPGKRYNGMPREAAYRHGLGVLRQAMGNDAYFLTCGALILPSLGLCNGLRAGPDVSGNWDPYLETRLLDNPSVPGVRNAIRTTVSRIWLQSLLHIDPDVAYFCTRSNNLAPAQKKLLQDLALITSFKATSDLPAWLSEEERAALLAFLEAAPHVEHIARSRYRLDGRTVDFTEALLLPPSKGRTEHLTSAVLARIANLPAVLRLNDWLIKRAVEHQLER